MYQTQPKTTQLGQTSLEITRVGFGAWALGGGDWEHGWGPQDDDESIAARALRGLSERPYVFTKCSLLEGPDPHIALSNFGVGQLRRIQQIAPVETLQPHYSLIERDIEREILPFAEREAIGKNDIYEIEGATR